MKIGAVISDLDGVIVNSENEHFLSFQKMLKDDYDIDYTKKRDEGFLGTTDVHVFSNLKKMYPKIKEPMAELIDRRTEIFIEMMTGKVKPLPGVLDLFDRVRKDKIPLALGTSASRGVVEFTLTTLKLRDYFKTVVCANDVQHGKPAPDIYLEISKRLNVPPEKCLVFEDSFNGVTAAKAAGMKCIAVPCGPTLKEDLSMADHIVNSLTDVTPELLQSFY